MHSPNSIWHRLRFVALVAVAVLATYAVARSVVERATIQERSVPHEAAVLPPGLDEEGNPLSAYVAIAPALVPAFEAGAAFDALPPLGVLVENIPPLGAYLPAQTAPRFALPTVTPSPRPSPTSTITLTPSKTPRPTWTPSPIPTGTIPPTATQTPDVTPTPSYTPSITPPPTLTPYVIPPEATPVGYGGYGCAPEGWPVAGLLTQYYHWYHRGIDLGAPLNSGVVATHSGIVKFAGWRTDGYGNLIILENGPFITYYAHLNGFNVREGDLVPRGAVIGWVGSTGNSSGPHVHYEIRINDSEVDPLTFESRGFLSC